MELTIEGSWVQESSYGTPSRDDGSSLTQYVCNDDEEDCIHVHRLWLEVENLGEDGSEARESDAKNECTECEGMLVRVVGYVECLGDKLKVAIENCIVRDL